MPIGASPKREREYKELVGEFKKEHRYTGREKEVASRIVNKQRNDFGETKGDKKAEKERKSPDRNLPIERYDHLTIADIKRKLSDLKAPQKRKIAAYERNHKNRKGVFEALKGAA
ncbi:MAG TPA: hypothetical protein VEX68_09220 [Bryobacteraceae bacterium]|nr:hypothetical protein [Bryobacteraceae bacterium]